MFWVTSAYVRLLQKLWPMCVGGTLASPSRSANVMGLTLLLLVTKQIVNATSELFQEYVFYNWLGFKTDTVLWNEKVQIRLLKYLKYVIHLFNT